MKNIIRFSVIIVLLTNAISMATVMQPAVPATEEAPFRLGLGYQNSLKKGPAGSESSSIGFDKIGGALSFSHDVGHNFEYGVALKSGALSLDNAYWGVDLMARYMPEVAQHFNLGFMLNTGIDGDIPSILFQGFSINPNAFPAFGFLNVKLGPAMSYRFAPWFALSFAPQATMTKIFFVKDGASEEVKENRNYFGVAAPVAGLFGITNNIGIVLEANPMISRFNKIPKGLTVANYFSVESTLGVTYSF